MDNPEKLSTLYTRHRTNNPEKLNTTQDTGRTIQRNYQHCTQDTGRTIQRNSQHLTRHRTNNPEKLSTLHKTQDEQSREALNTTQDTGRRQTEHRQLRGWATQTPPNTGDEHRCSRRGVGSCHLKSCITWCWPWAMFDSYKHQCQYHPITFSNLIHVVHSPPFVSLSLFYHCHDSTNWT